MRDSSGTDEKCMPPTIVTMFSFIFFAISTVRAQVYALQVKPEVKTIEGSNDSICFSSPSQFIRSP